MALCRPHPDEKRRYIFNWAHWFVGTLAQILSGIITLILVFEYINIYMPVSRRKYNENVPWI